MTRRIGVPLLICAVAGLLATWFIWTLAKGHLELGGGHPDRAAFASIQSVAQRATKGPCNGVLVTPEATWLVGTLERPRSDVEVPDDATDLADRFGGDASNDDGAMASTTMLGGFGGRDYYSYISRLDDDGRFHLVAYLASAACLRTSPDGRRVYVTSGMRRPDDRYDNDDPASRQDAVFVSDDQGESWRWAHAGFMVPAVNSAWSGRPYTDDHGTVWAWTKLPRSKASNGRLILGGDGSGLYYSTDGGRTTTEVPQNHPLLASPDDLRKLLPDGMRTTDAAPVGEVSPYVMRLGPDRAGIWASQEAVYIRPDAPGQVAGVLRLTRHAVLTRDTDTGEWQMGKIQQQNGVAIRTMRQGPDGRVRAIVRFSDETTNRVAAIDRNTLELTAHADLPNAFGPLQASAYIRGFWVGQHSMVVNVSNTYTVPKWINVGEWISGDEAHISGDAAFYSTDDGDSWHKLGVRGYQGILGFDAATDRLFWSEKPYYKGGTTIEVDHLATD